MQRPRSLPLNNFTGRLFQDSLCSQEQGGQTSGLADPAAAFLRAPADSLLTSSLYGAGTPAGGVFLPVKRPAPPDYIQELPGGYLVLLGGAHSVADLFTGKSPPVPGSEKRFFDNTAQRAQWCASRGIGFHTWIFPDKLVALRHLNPDGDRINSIYRSHYVSSEHFRPDLPVTYLLDRVCSDDYYCKTDTHFSATGLTDIAAAMMAQSLDLRDPGLLETISSAHVLDRNRVNDLGRHFTPWRREDNRRLPYPPGVMNAGNGFAGGNDGMLLLAESPEARTDKTLLIFGDSFFNQLRPYLAYAFRRIVFCRTRFFHTELVSAVRPDIIFCGLAERYLSDVAPDSERPHFLAYPHMSGRPQSPTPQYANLWNRMFDNHALAATDGEPFATAAAPAGEMAVR